MRGRKPLPTAVKELNGYQKSKINRNEPTPRSSLVEIPDYLSEPAKAEFTHIVAELEAMNLLTSADIGVVSVLADVTARYKAAQQQVDEQGFTILTPNGYPCIHPSLTVVNKCIQQLQRLYVELGLTPSSRSRIKAQPREVVDEYENFLNS